MRSDFRVREDGAIAHRLQEQECKMSIVIKFVELMRALYVLKRECFFHVLIDLSSKLVPC